MEDNQKHVVELVKKASEAEAAHEAMHYSQAACNAANALRVLQDLKKG